MSEQLLSGRLHSRMHVWAVGAMLVLTPAVGQAQPTLQVEVDDQAVAHEGIHDFGEVEVGSAVNVSYRIRNLGLGQLNFDTSASGPSAADFSGLGGLSGSVTVAGGASVTFRPSAVGLRAVTLVVTSTGTPNPYIVHVIGTGVASNANGGFILCGNGMAMALPFGLVGLCGLKRWHRRSGL